jgi:hypothetical protein
MTAIRKPLAESGLVFIHGARPVMEGNRLALVVRTELWHVSGQWLRNDLPVGIFGSSPQDIGTGISYAKRYNVLALANLSPGGEEDDDDGVGASNRRPASPPQPAARRSQAPVQGQTGAAPAGPQPAHAPSPIGTIAAIEEKGTGMLVKLSTGYTASTKNDELKRVLRVYEGNKATVELMTHPSSDAKRFAPIIDEVVLRKREAAGANQQS